MTSPESFTMALMDSDPPWYFEYLTSAFEPLGPLQIIFLLLNLRWHILAVKLKLSTGGENVPVRLSKASIRPPFGFNMLDRTPAEEEKGKGPECGFCQVVG